MALIEDTYRQRDVTETPMDVGVILFAIIASVIGMTFAKQILFSRVRSDSSRALVATIFIIVTSTLGLAHDYSNLLTIEISAEGIESRADNINYIFELFTVIIGIAMGFSLANIVWYGVRMDIVSHTLASTIGSASIWLLTKILHIYVISVDHNFITGIAVGYILVEVLDLFEMLYDEFKKRRRFQASSHGRASHMYGDV